MYLFNMNKSRYTAEGRCMERWNFTGLPDLSIGKDSHHRSEECYRREAPTESAGGLK